MKKRGNKKKSHGFGFLFRFVAKEKPSWFFFIVLLSLTAFTGPLTTTLSPKLIMDELSSSEIRLKAIAIIIGVVALCNLTRAVLKSIYSNTYAPKARIELSDKLGTKILLKAKEFDLAAYDKPEFHDQYVRAVEQSECCVADYLNSVYDILDRFMYIATIISIISSLDSVLIAFSLLSVGSMFFFSRKYTNRAYQTERMLTGKTRKIAYVKRIHSLPQYAKEMKVYEVGQLLRLQFNEANIERKEITVKRSIVQNILQIVNETMTALLLTLITTIYLVYRIYTHSLQVSSFVVLFLATTQLSFELFAFINYYNNLHQAVMRANDIQTVLEYQGKIECTADQGESLQSVNDIRIDDVSFRYREEDPLILRNLNLSIEKGQHIALVGYNGAGKTTLTKLLLRLYDCSSGTIKINGRGIADYRVEDIRRCGQIVFQDFQIYPITVAENVLLRRLKTDEDRALAIDALKRANLYEYVMTLPDGIDTVVTKEFDASGIVFSGGQMQRLAAARIFANPQCSVVITDEISSALDPIATKTLNQSIIDFCRNKILIVISHQLSTTVDADNIYYIESGAILETGTHKELMSMGGKYAAMFSAQAENYKNNE